VDYVTMILLVGLHCGDDQAQCRAVYDKGFVREQGAEQSLSMPKTPMQRPERRQLLDK
jgi:hypothetical protein